MSLLLAQAPALPLHKAGPFVFAAYIVFVAIILVYVTIMAIRLGRSQRELLELKREVDRRAEPAEQSGDAADAQARVLPRS